MFYPLLSKLFANSIITYALEYRINTRVQLNLFQTLFRECQGTNIIYNLPLYTDLTMYMLQVSKHLFRGLC